MGKAVRLAKGVSAAPSGHVGQIQGIHHEPFFSVGTGDGVAYVPASYLDVGFQQPVQDPNQGNSSMMDDDEGQMDGDPVPTSDTDQSDVPAYAAKVPAPQDVARMLLEWRHRRHC